MQTKEELAIVVAVKIAYHAAEGIIIASKVDAQRSAQLIIGPAMVLGPANSLTFRRR